MLIIKRHKDEVIKIGDDIEIMVTRINAKTDNPSATLGIVAPPELSVHRQEIYEAIQKEKNDNKC